MGVPGGGDLHLEARAERVPRRDPGQGLDRERVDPGAQQGIGRAADDERGVGEQGRVGRSPGDRGELGTHLPRARDVAGGVAAPGLGEAGRRVVRALVSAADVHGRDHTEDGAPHVGTTG